MDFKKLPKNEFTAAIQQIAGERGIDVQSILDSIELGLISAYKRDQKEKGNIIDDDVPFEAELAPESGSFKIYRIDQGNKLDVTPPGFGRIATQTAKQVIDQKINEAEKEIVIQEFMDKVGELIHGIIIKIDPYKVTVNVGKAEAILPKEEQIPGERMNLGERKLFLIQSIVEDDVTGKKDVILSRSDEEFLAQLFIKEVPELANGSVTIERVARISGVRSKIAVNSNQPGVDPVGSCIGQRGSRIQAILNELPEFEKVDVVLFSQDINQFIINSLSPAQGIKILSSTQSKVSITVPDDQLALTIGSNGDNVKLAGRLVGMDIEVVSSKKTSA